MLAWLALTPLAASIFLATAAANHKTLPSNNQGYGMPNRDAMFNDEPNVCDNCRSGPTFALGADAVDFTVCTTATNFVLSDLTSSAIERFVTPVTLSMTGPPARSTTNFSTNPVTPTGARALTIGNLNSIAAGVSNMTLSATSGVITKTRAMSLTAFTQAARTLWC
ncbi:hypothetical protein C7S18_04390 [Ahniella affigens]|uniref:Uncharacterized protein n=1 Tax=Ahniella affigens TaxID=2021234 RepID=A0A2P1PNR3_9GAMM|nr:hypothetical protein [Ahniella affigens]AVP96480.1 hypothetical protein C7S18_04390 [Ahniella affigens]